MKSLRFVFALLCLACSSLATAMYFDGESGLDYNYYRSYRPSDGRYTQPDPVGLRGGPSRFLYAAGDPLTRVDPFGLADYAALPVVEGHLRWLATIQGDSFLRSPFWAAEREMLNRLKRGEETPWDVAFYRHEMAEAQQCRSFLTAPPDEALRRQKEAHEKVLRDHQNREQDLYHPDVVQRHRDLFSPRWFSK